MCSNDARREISDLSELLRKYNYEYHVQNSPTVSDLEYDRLFNRLKELEASFPALVEPDSPGSRRNGAFPAALRLLQVPMDPGIPRPPLSLDAVSRTMDG